MLGGADIRFSSSFAEPDAADRFERPALQQLLADIQAGKIGAVVCYKVDRLSRSQLDFARMMEAFDKPTT